MSELDRADSKVASELESVLHWRQKVAAAQNGLKAAEARLIAATEEQRQIYRRAGAA